MVWSVLLPPAVAAVVAAVVPVAALSVFF